MGRDWTLYGSIRTRWRLLSTSDPSTVVPRAERLSRDSQIDIHLTVGDHTRFALACIKPSLDQRVQ
jgi:hypothetical protein